MDRIAPDRPVTLDPRAADTPRPETDRPSADDREARRAAELAPSIDAWNDHWAEHGSVADEFRDEGR
jgi:hypothetical protein